MLAVIATEGATLDAGSVALGLARRWCHAGARVLFVDAEVSGSTLAERLGAVDRAEYLPAVRGLPSLFVAREPLSLPSVAAHCYGLQGGDLWALFGPSHPDGGEHAVAWLAGRVAEMQAIDRQRRVVLASSMRPGATGLTELLQAAPVLVVLAPVQGRKQAASLWQLLRDAGLMGFRRNRRALVVEGESPLDDDEIRVESGLHVVGRLPLVGDEGALRQKGTRRHRAFRRQLHKAADLLLALVSLDAGAGSVEPDEAHASEPASRLQPLGPADPPGPSRANGSRAGRGRLLSASRPRPRTEARRRQRRP